jgi:hypothetical protein
VSPVAQLVDADDAQVLELVAGAKPRHHALDDAADGRPADAHHVAETLSASTPGQVRVSS